MNADKVGFWVSGGIMVLALLWAVWRLGKEAGAVRAHRERDFADLRKKVLDLEWQRTEGKEL
ncbi:hypothetical protein TPY_3191 [Sulfobacillus acidophilus TPY]|uniref:Uncharacterized protein n=1 Tax=Sulfobacillus acidophilus (strain ATCC 700253 / DSM 10332 / NAL) TaxID=679936 RepID=G8TZH8_SULAD|nr:hypothetical protein TPY_3191 [Sulfobacillus acidophilus TPY]AEW05218.1 hypothetical protein Sulac_1722 [Sulfobacillus acidophilus DSM 10332]